MPDNAVGFSRDRTARDRPKRQFARTPIIQKSGWRADLARYNEPEFTAVRRRFYVSRVLVAEASQTSPILGGFTKRII